MNNRFNDIIKPGLALFIIALVASALLGAVNFLTKPIIEQNNIKEKKQAMLEVLPLANGGSFGDDMEGDLQSGILSYNIGYENNKPVGCAVSVKTKGYGGEISMLVGIDINGEITGIKLLDHNETPGLGAKATTDAFRSQFVGKSGELSVTKNATAADNEIVAIASATITTKAVTAGVNAAMEFYKNISAGGNVK